MVFIGIKIRKARMEDLSEIKSIAKDVINNYYREYFKESDVNKLITSGIPYNYITLNLDLLKVIQQENCIIGFCILKGRAIDLIMVKPSVQKLEGKTPMDEIYHLLLKGHDVNLLDLPSKTTQKNYLYVKTHSTPS